MSSFVLNVCTERPYIALGLEGSANKLGAGIIKHSPDGSTEVLSNVRHTYITPPGEGFLPRDTAQHHREWALTVIKDAFAKAGISLHDIDCICFTKGKIDGCVNAYDINFHSRSWYGCTAHICGTGRTNAIAVV